LFTEQDVFRDAHQAELVELVGQLEVFLARCNEQLVAHQHRAKSIQNLPKWFVVTVPVYDTHETIGTITAQTDKVLCALSEVQ
jgi:hypothetical protein